MDKDIIKLQKNNETEIVVRVDDFGGRRGVTIREFVKSDRYTGFTKAGTRISAENFKAFKDAINSIDESELAMPAESQKTEYKPKTSQQSFGDDSKKTSKKEIKVDEDIEDQEF